MDARRADDLDALCAAVQLVMPDDAAFSVTTAAALWGLPLPHGHDPVTDLHVTGAAGRRPVDARAIQQHEGLDPGDLTWTRGLRVTNPARTWADLGALAAGPRSRTTVPTPPPVSFGPPDLVVVTDALLRGTAGRSPYPRDLLARRLAQVHGRRGAATLRRALDVSRRFVDSPMETRLRLRLVDSGFPCPVVGADVLDDDGRWLARPDLSWPGLRIAVEHDGRHHLVSAKQRLDDVARQEELARLGWSVIVLFSHDVLRRWPSTEGRVLQAFYDRGVRPEDFAPAPDVAERPRIVTSSIPR
ncbi:hypothetical protein IF650_11785 [Cellulosimicrobium terreum]|nr:hypothetical protein [Cellulosimicrobium terreum]